MHTKGQPAWKSSNLLERPRVRTFENWASLELFPHHCHGNYYRACPCVCARIRGAARCFVCDRLLGTHQTFHNRYLLLSLWCLIGSVCPYFILGSHFLLFQTLLKMAFYSYRLSNQSVLLNSIQSQRSVLEYYIKETEVHSRVLQGCNEADCRGEISDCIIARSALGERENLSPLTVHGAFSTPCRESSAAVYGGRLQKPEDSYHVLVKTPFLWCLWFPVALFLGQHDLRKPAWVLLVPPTTVYCVCSSLDHTCIAFPRAEARIPEESGDNTSASALSCGMEPHLQLCDQ